MSENKRQTYISSIVVSSIISLIIAINNYNHYIFEIHKIIFDFIFFAIGGGIAFGYIIDVINRKFIYKEDKIKKLKFKGKPSSKEKEKRKIKYENKLAISTIFYTLIAVIIYILLLALFPKNTDMTSLDLYSFIINVAVIGKVIVKLRENFVDVKYKLRLYFVAFILILSMLLTYVMGKVIFRSYYPIDIRIYAITVTVMFIITLVLNCFRKK